MCLCMCVYVYMYICIYVNMLAYICVQCCNEDMQDTFIKIVCLKHPSGNEIAKSLSHAKHVCAEHKIATSIVCWVRMRDDLYASVCVRVCC